MAGRAMRLRVVDWNVNGRRDVARQMELVDSLGWDVALLQEVRPAGFEAFRAHPSFGAGDMALAHRPDRVADGVPWGAAILVREGVELVASAPMVNVPSPERALVGLERVEGVLVEVAALAAPPASSGWKRAKAMQVQRFGECWASRSYPMVAGIDRNAPKMDHPDLARAVWFWEEERRVFGSDTAHDLRDVLRTYLETHPRKLRRIVKERPDGPLATSFMRGKGKGHKPGRYDAIYASPELEVRDVRYPFDEAIAAGSDHGLVWAELELRSDYVAPAGMRSGFWKDRSRGQRRTREVKG